MAKNAILAYGKNQLLAEPAGFADYLKEVRKWVSLRYYAKKPFKQLD